MLQRMQEISALNECFQKYAFVYVFGLSQGERHSSSVLANACWRGENIAFGPKGF